MPEKLEKIVAMVKTNNIKTGVFFRLHQNKQMSLYVGTNLPQQPFI